MKTLLLVVALALSSCAVLVGDPSPSIAPVEGGYEVSTSLEGVLVIGAGADITSWQPYSACEYRPVLAGPKRAIACKAPVSVKVFTTGKVRASVVNP
ncbi:MAG: hypothetical protein IVW51_15395 [Thermaceae bacterium]|nr:hypothetical protein [Thermaceae bacterium]